MPTLAARGELPVSWKRDPRDLGAVAAAVFSTEENSWSRRCFLSPPQHFKPKEGAPRKLPVELGAVCMQSAWLLSHLCPSLVGCLLSWRSSQAHLMMLLAQSGVRRELWAQLDLCLLDFGGHRGWSSQKTAATHKGMARSQVSRTSPIAETVWRDGWGSRSWS